MDENELRKNYILKNGDQIGIAIKQSGSSARKKVDHGKLGLGLEHEPSEPAH